MNAPQFMRLLPLFAIAALGLRPAHAQSITKLGIPADDDSMTEEDSDGPLGRFNARSQGRQMADQLLSNARSGGIVGGEISSGDESSGDAEHGDDLRNVQVNDPALDHIVRFSGTRPFELSTQSETSVARHGRHVVIGYNTTAFQKLELFPQGLFFTQRFFTGYSVSHDGGRTWKSSFTPPAQGSSFTFGDPAVAVDREGHFFFASLGADAEGNAVVNVNKSTDDGSTFGTATIVATDNGGDKEWIAVGPAPKGGKSDNVYVTWTHFRDDGSGSDLLFARSTDGGNSWKSKPIFVPNFPATGINSNFIQFSNPVVDSSNGRLYIPFLHFSNVDADNIRVLVSDDAGETFSFLAFKVTGAVDASAFPIVTPGEVIDCGRNSGGIRNVLHQGTDEGGGRFGLARYRHATRLITQPAAAVSRGKLFIAFNTSTSPFSGDPAAGSEIDLLYSPNGGKSWAPPFTVAASTAADPQHVHPAIALGEDSESVSVAHYVQQADSKLRTDVATIQAGDALKLKRTAPLSSQSFDLTPSNIPFPIRGNRFFTTNYDRSVRACYNIGEYMSITGGADGAFAAWGDNRNSWTGPADSAQPGKHAQPDVIAGSAEGD